MSVKYLYLLKDLDVSKLPEDVRKYLAEPAAKHHKPYHAIWFHEDHARPEYLSSVDREGQLFGLDFVQLEEDGTPTKIRSHRTDDGWEMKDAVGFSFGYFDSAGFTYPLKEYFESIKL